MAENTKINSETIQNFADPFFAEQMEPLQVPGAALVVVKGDEVIYSKGYGYSSLEEKIPTHPFNTVFRVGSVSKLFTTTALLQLFDRGLLDLDADINTYLKEFQVNSPDGTPITAAQLLTHTAGFEENYIGMHVRKEDDLLPLGDFLSTHLPPIHNQPGTIISYNDHGMSLAGFIVEAISGIPFDQYIRDHILKPLEMNSSSFSQPPGESLMGRMATGYRYQGNGYQTYPYDYINVNPAAALVSSTEDISHFIIALLNEGRYEDVQLLSAETVKMMQSRQYSHHPLLRGRAYGFAEWLENGQQAFYHDGGNPGFLNRLLILPEQEVGFFIALNGDQQSKAVRLTREFTTKFLNTFFPEEEMQIIDPPVPPDFSTRADLYTGYYREQAGYSSKNLTKLDSLLNQVVVKPGSDNTMNINGGNAIEVASNVFRWKDSDNHAVFRQDSKGKVDYLFIGTGAFEKLPWYEAQPFHLVLAFLYVAGFIGMILLAIFARSISPAFRVSYGLTGLLNLVFLAGIAYALLNMDHWHIFYGLPTGINLLLVLPIITTIFSIGLVILTGATWVTGNTTLGLRSLVSLLTLVAIGFIPLLVYWNLLGFKQ